MVFGPRTLVRTWGTRPVPSGLLFGSWLTRPVPSGLPCGSWVRFVLFGSQVGGLIDKLEAYRHEPEG
jgi:hypothetical protein